MPIVLRGRRINSFELVLVRKLIEDLNEKGKRIRQRSIEVKNCQSVFHRFQLPNNQ